MFMQMRRRRRTSSPYRTPASVPPPEPVPVPYREPVLHRIAFLVFLVLGPVFSVGATVGAFAFAAPVPACVLVGFAAFLAHVITPMAMFDTSISDTAKRLTWSTRLRLSATFWALPTGLAWLAYFTWRHLCSLGRWVRDGEER